MARGKRSHVENIKDEEKPKKSEVVEDNDTEIGTKANMAESDDDGNDGDTSDSSVYSDLEDGN
jgi:hypothetical protein